MKDIIFVFNPVDEEIVYAIEESCSIRYSDYAIINSVACKIIGYIYGADNKQIETLPVEKRVSPDFYVSISM